MPHRGQYQRPLQWVVKGLKRNQYRKRTQMFPNLRRVQTFVIDSPQRLPNVHVGDYRTMLEYLLDNDPIRHVPNVRIFWVPTAWELRDVVEVRYVKKAMPNLNGRYCLFMSHGTLCSSLTRPSSVRQQLCTTARRPGGFRIPRAGSRVSQTNGRVRHCCGGPTCSPCATSPSPSTAAPSPDPPCGSSAPTSSPRGRTRRRKNGATRTSTKNSKSASKTDVKERLQVNRYLSNEKIEYFGDAFVLKEVGYKGFQVTRGSMSKPKHHSNQDHQMKLEVPGKNLYRFLERECNPHDGQGWNSTEEEERQLRDVGDSRGDGQMLKMHRDLDLMDKDEDYEPPGKVLPD